MRTPQLRIAIATSHEVAVHAVQRNGLLLVVPQAAGDMIRKEADQELQLDRPNIYDFEKALVAMGMEESDARRYALSTGRSWSVLRRHCAQNPAIRHPTWLDSPQSTSLITVCLLGTWNEGKEADKRVVERVAGQPYEVIEANLRHLAQVDDAPILHIGSVWKAKSPLELLDLFGSRITSSQLDRFFQIAVELLSFPDPQLELPESERYAAQVHGKVRPQSGLLFEALCDTLIKLAVRGPDIPALLNLNIEGRVARLVSDLLEGADAIRWLSLASCLPALAEAAPIVFLRAVERSLDDCPDSAVAQLILETTDTGIGGRCWHSGLLWALETLAWAPKWLARVAFLLARLTQVPYNSRWANTPGNSLLGLFRTWFPQTSADLPARLSVLKSLVQRDPDAAFELLNAIIERGPQHATPAAHPKWRDDDAGAGRVVPWDEQYDMHIAAREHIYCLSVGNAPRIIRLFENTDLQDIGEMARVLNLMRPFTLEEASDEDRVALQSALRQQLNWHRNYGKKSSGDLQAQLVTIDILYKDLSPIDLIQRHRWLFSSHWPELPECDKHEQDKTVCLVTEARSDALKDIIQNLGMAGVERLITECDDPYSVGLTLAQQDEVAGKWSEWIIQQVGDFLASPTSQCIAGLLRHLPEQRAHTLQREVLALGRQNSWEAERQAQFLTLALPVRFTWELAIEMGAATDAAYWRSVPIFGRMQDSRDDVVYVLQRLLESCRPRTALQYCLLNLKQSDARLLFEILHRFLQGEEAEGPQLASWHIEKAIKRLEQSGDIEKTALIQLEFNLFPVLRYANKAYAPALFEAVTSDPAIFAELISLAFKPEHGEREETDALRNAASTAWEILHACKRQPGTRTDGSIDPDVFIEFIEMAREKCRKTDRLRWGEYALGELLAHAPADEDGTWPFEQARQVLDRPDLEEMRRGFYFGAINKRGVTTRGPWDGGDQERDLADYYRSQAAKIQHDQFYVAELLESLARSYEHHAEREDNEANLRKESF